MLTQDTKRKIDSARDILVGKVPDPKAQVEQITTALIYKFMDDMDKDAVEMGGAERFFSNGYEKYAWSKVLDPKLSGQERLNLYTEALTKLARNPHIPQLFRDIFKDAFLPYRSPETLHLFLKEVNSFTYNHSEDLGDAFEYLLSIMGSQGDAGQFRTPRHIIDFIVAVVDPKKDETICDPACGTAGFLISAYKHIIRQHDGVDENGSVNSEQLLTPDEKSKMMNNLTGYDISPDMVRMSKVNMYLHGFADPKIYEYDTLSSEEKWDETFDVMLANPPFMTPKGGIKPHKRFGVQANRAEVLFVDYIKEHLHPNGRAGIIVPEGIIFQSGTAYKALRKSLVEDGLFAVVSLPQGVFNPYAGVKTSILFFDNSLAKKTKNIIFIKIENDGRDLGAQRRQIEKNDIPIVTTILNDYKKTISNGTGSLGNADEFINHFDFDHSRVSIIPKEKISASGDYNLSGDRYKEVETRVNQQWPMVELKDICAVDWGNTNLTKSSYVEDGKYLAVSATGCDGRIDKYEHKIGVTVLSAIGANCGKVFFPDENFTAIKNTITFTPEKDRILSKYLFYIMQKNKLPRRGGGQPFMSKGDVQKYRIVLPPIDVQKEIVEQIDNYQEVIDGAQAVVENWKPSFVVDSKWPIKKLSEISERVTKGTTPTTAGFAFQETGINFIKIEAIDDSGYFLKDKFSHIDEECNKEFKRSQLKFGDVLFSIAGALGRVALVNKDILPANTNQALAIITPKENLNSKYLSEVLRSPLIFNKIDGLKVGVAQYNISLTQVSDFEIPLPALEIQKQIVAKIEDERKIVEANRKLMDIFQQKIANVLDKI